MILMVRDLGVQSPRAGCRMQSGSSVGFRSMLTRQIALS